MEEKRFMLIAAALAEPRRFAILEAITRAREISCGGLAGLFPVGQPTVSHHVSILEKAELVTVRRQGQHAIFSPVPETLSAFVKELQRRLQVKSTSPAGGGIKKRKGGRKWKN